MKYLLRIILVCIFYADVNFLFAWSTKTFTTSADFMFYKYDGITLSGSDNITMALSNKWINQEPMDSPAARSDSAIAYDVSLSSFVLFSGRGTDSNPIGYIIGDMWIYSPASNKWKYQIGALPGPEPRYGHKLVSIGNGEFFLFGGSGQNGYLNDTWIYNYMSNTWSRKNQFIIEPSSRACFALEYVPENNKVYLFGGYGQGKKYNDLWAYDIISDSWSFVVVTSSPVPRSNHSITYNSREKVLVLFGGESQAAYLNDLWYFDIISNNWSLKWPNNPVSSQQPRQRKNHGMIYIPSVNRTLVYSGIILAENVNDVWMYQYSNNTWYNSGLVPVPPVRDSFSLCLGMDSLPYLFGGYAAGTGAQSDLWVYSVRSSGTFISQNYSIPYNTTFEWLSISFPPANIYGTRKLQISDSTDGNNWSEYYGFGGFINTYFEYSGTPVPLNSKKNYIRIKGEFSSDILPNVPEMNSIILTYNRTPAPPTNAITPENNSKINQVLPAYSWNKSVIDKDGDTEFSYRYQVSKSSFFSGIYIDNSNIVNESSGSIYHTSYKKLSTGIWYWRIAAKDTSEGPWSNSFKFFVDTSPPDSVNTFTANRGDINGEIDLSWICPDDDSVLTGNMAGEWLIKYSSIMPVGTESEWDSIPDERKTYFISLPGNNMMVSITGLADNTTYYFAVKIKDEAGNISQISTVSPCGYTNAKPYVELLLEPGYTWPGTRVINWYYSDPNAGDSLSNIMIILSSDSGKNFDIKIADKLPDKTTYYLWNTKEVKNGGYQLKIIVTDKNGLSAESISIGTITIININEPPDINLIYPAGNEILAGKVNMSWDIIDPNLSDNHIVDVYISSGFIVQYYKLLTLSGNSTYYVFDTTGFDNSPYYKLKLVVTDEYGLFNEDSAESYFSISNNNHTPNGFRLLYPGDSDRVSPYKVIFEWENNGDPDKYDSVRHRIYISTNAGFNVKQTIDDLSINEYIFKKLMPETTYYWKVVSYDWFGVEKECDKVFKFVTYNRFKAKSYDGVVDIELLDKTGISESDYILVEKYGSPGNSRVLSAGQNVYEDRLLKTLPGESVYSINIYDINDNIVNQKILRILISYKIINSDNDNYYDKDSLILIPNLKLASFDEFINQWVLLNSINEYDAVNKTINVVSNHLSLFRLVASDIPCKGISGINIYPNPFNPGNEQAHIRYVLTQDAEISIKIYTLLGDIVREWNFSPGIPGKSAGNQNGAVNELLWNGYNGDNKIVSDNMYIIQIIAKFIDGKIEKEFKYAAVTK